MKRIIACVMFVVAASALSLNAEPQIAFRLLDDYIQDKQEKAEKSRVAEGVLGIVSGAVFMGAAATMWFAGDQIYSAASGGQSMNQGLKLGATIGLAAGGGLFTYGGVSRLVSRTDLRKQYAPVYEEKDPDVQEALAAATLHDFYKRGHNQRIGYAITKLSVAAITLAVTIGGNIATNGALSWSDNLDGALYGNAWNISSGIGDLFRQSKEELLYEKYLAAKDALYSRAKDQNGDQGQRE